MCVEKEQSAFSGLLVSKVPKHILATHTRTPDGSKTKNDPPFSFQGSQTCPQDPNPVDVKVYLRNKFLRAHVLL